MVARCNPWICWSRKTVMNYLSSLCLQNPTNKSLSQLRGYQKCLRASYMPMRHGCSCSTIMGNEQSKKLPLKKLCFKDLFIMTGINSPLQKNSILSWDVTRNWITNTKQIIICTKYFQILKEPSSENHPQRENRLKWYLFLCWDPAMFTMDTLNTFLGKAIHTVTPKSTHSAGILLKYLTIINYVPEWL